MFTLSRHELSDYAAWRGTHVTAHHDGLLPDVPRGANFTVHFTPNADGVAKAVTCNACGVRHVLTAGEEGV